MNLSKHLRLLLLALAVILGALDSWSSRYFLNAMGVSYLDMGDAFIRGEWRMALNGLWGPLYSLPLALSARLIGPSPRWEFPLVHLVNFLIFLAALFAFDLFLRELIRRQREERASAPRRETVALPEWAMIGLGYAVFIWCSLGLINMSTTAPDLLLSVFVYLAFAMLLRIRRGHANWRSFLFLGLILGFGYLAKSAMLPLAPLFILVGLFLVGNLRKAAAHAAAALLGLVLVAGPFIVALSASKHRLTSGDAGKLNYLWHVNRVPPFHWQGADTRYGTPKHPTRKIFERPAVYEFGSPLNATYPPWYDPSYWYDGVTPRFDFSQQKSALRKTAGVYWEIFSYRSHLVLFGGFLLLAYFGRRSWVRNLRSEWSVLILSCAAFALYLPVHVETRYVAPFILPFWLALFAALRLPAEAKSRTLTRYIVVTVVTVMIFAQIGRSISSVRAARTDLVAVRKAEFLHLQVAEDLNRRGIKSGDAVGMLNFSSTWLPIVHWARLAHVRIIAELPNTDADVFAAADDSRRREVIETFARTGAKALVAMDVPEKVTLRGWERVGQTDYYVLKLR